jgi:hypothetical protein
LPFHKKHTSANRGFFIFTAFWLGTRLDTGTRNGTLEEREGGWIVDNMITDQPDLPTEFLLTGLSSVVDPDRYILASWIRIRIR